MPREATSDSLWNSSGDDDDDHGHGQYEVAYDLDDNDIDKDTDHDDNEVQDEVMTLLMTMRLQLNLVGEQQKAVSIHPACHLHHVSCGASTFAGLLLLNNSK